MAIALNDILQITWEQTYLSRVALNVYFYKVTTLTGTPTYEEVGDAFALAVIDKVNAIQSNQVANVGYEIKNVTNELDIFSDVNTALGDVANEALPAFNAWGFRLVRATALTRHGSKRYVGIPETWVTNGTPNASFTTARDELIAVLDDPLTVDGATGDCVITPVIVGRVFDETEGYYKLDLTRINSISAVAFSRITSQVSRKYAD